MLTVRQLERLWNTEQFDRIISICMEMRIEQSTRLRMRLGGSAPSAAAIAMIRMDELNQSHAPLYTRLLRAILAAQQADGGWGDPLATALCIRALMCGHGAGPSIDRGLQYLAALQKTDGSWPEAPFRRMPADPLVSAFVWFCLASDERFRRSVRCDDAVHWFEANQRTFDADTTRIWRSAATRCRCSSAAPANLPGLVLPQSNQVEVSSQASNLRRLAPISG